MPALCACNEFDRRSICLLSPVIPSPLTKLLRHVSVVKKPRKKAAMSQCTCEFCMCDHLLGLEIVSHTLIAIISSIALFEQITHTKTDWCLRPGRRLQSSARIEANGTLLLIYGLVEIRQMAFLPMISLHILSIFCYWRSLICLKRVQDCMSPSRLADNRGLSILSQRAQAP